MKRLDTLPDLEPRDELEALKLARPNAPCEVWTGLVE
jgi:hypothetical protein